MEDVRLTALENEGLNHPQKMDSTDNTSVSSLSLNLLFYSLFWTKHF